jgi:hypothetical protein
MIGLTVGIERFTNAQSSPCKCKTSNPSKFKEPIWKGRTRRLLRRRDWVVEEDL